MWNYPTPSGPDTIVHESSGRVKAVDILFIMIMKNRKNRIYLDMSNIYNNNKSIHKCSSSASYLPQHHNHIISNHKLSQQQQLSTKKKDFVLKYRKVRKGKDTNRNRNKYQDKYQKWYCPTKSFSTRMGYG